LLLHAELCTAAQVATPGEGSDALSVYCAATGRVLSRGQLGFDASVAFAGGAVDAPLLLAHGGALHAYAPQWAADAAV
jgi:hypothetical protein